MTQSHDDRIADRSPDLCFAYGCPLLGSMSANTMGTTDWLCFVHFGCEISQYQRITAELRSLDWLSQAITDIRTRHHSPAEWAARYQRIEHDLVLNQREDLRFNGAMHSRMDTELWLRRLETELGALIQALVPAAPLQAAIPAEGKSHGSFNRVGFEVPA